MRKNIFILICVVLVIGFIFLGVYKGKRPNATKKSATNVLSEGSTERGSITGINLKYSTLVLSTKMGNTLTVIAEKNTLIAKEGKHIKLADVKKGDPVKVTYRKKLGKNVASLINIEKYTPLPPKSKARR